MRSTLALSLTDPTELVSNYACLQIDKYVTKVWL